MDLEDKAMELLKQAFFDYEDDNAKAILAAVNGLVEDAGIVRPAALAIVKRVAYKLKEE